MFYKINKSWLSNLDRVAREITYEDFLSPLKERYHQTSDVTENDDEFLIEICIPGLDKESIVVEVKDNVLTIAGEGKYPEYVESKFTRKYKLGSPVQVDSISAKYDSGILFVKLPKKESTKAVRVPVT